MPQMRSLIHTEDAFQDVQPRSLDGFFCSFVKCHVCDSLEEASYGVLSVDRRTCTVGRVSFNKLRWTAK